MFEASHVQHNPISGFIQIVSDGNYLPAFWSHPESGGPFPGLVLLHDQWGLSSHIRSQARRFAEIGYYVIAPDLFDRQTAHDPVQAAALVKQASETSRSNVAAALHALKTHHRCSGQIGIIGWGMGGGLALKTALDRDDLRALVIFYGLPEALAPADLHALRCPVLALFGGQDPGTPPEAVDSLRGGLAQAEVAHTVIVYDSARRGFFDDSRPDFDPGVAENAWTRTLEFLGDHLRPTPPDAPDPFDPGQVY